MTCFTVVTVPTQMPLRALTNYTLEAAGRLVIVKKEVSAVGVSHCVI